MMTLREIGVALKARYRPIFSGQIEREQRAMRVLVQRIDEDFQQTGVERAVDAVTKGVGE